MDYFKTAKWLLLVPVLVIFVVTTSTLFPFIVGKYVWFRTSIDLALISFLIGLLLQDKALIMIKRLALVFREPLVIAVTAFVGIFLLAGFFGVDPSMSFWSNFERGEGGLQLLHFLILFVLLITLYREEKDWNRLFYAALFGGILMALYGLFAGSGAEGFIGPKFGDPGVRFQGSIGNPAYVAAYSIFMLFYAAYLVISKFRQRLLSAGAIFLYIISAIFLATFWLAATRGAFLGLLAALAVFAGYFIYSHKEWRRWLIAGVVVLILAVGTLVKFKDTSFVKSIPGSRLFDISFTTETFAHRTYMWRIAYDGFKERPLLGWGPENFLRVFAKHFDTNYFVPGNGFGAWFDRAHSVYFDYLVETGILGFLSFLGIYIVLYWRLLKNAARLTLSSLQKALLVALPVAYLVQAIVLFDVYTIYLNIFIFLAFAAHHFVNAPQQAHTQKAS